MKMSSVQIYRLLKKKKGKVIETTRTYNLGIHFGGICFRMGKWCFVHGTLISPCLVDTSATSQKSLGRWRKGSINGVEFSRRRSYSYSERASRCFLPTRHPVPHRSSPDSRSGWTERRKELCARKLRWKVSDLLMRERPWTLYVEWALYTSWSVVDWQTE